MNYRMPKSLCPDSVVEVVRNCKPASGRRLLHWDRAGRVLSSVNEATGACLSMRLGEDEFCLNFLPPTNAMVGVSDMGGILFEMDYMPYEPFSLELKKRFPEKGNGKRYLIGEDAPYIDAQRCIKEMTEGLVTIKSLASMRRVRYRWVDLYPGRAELRTAERDALLIIPHRFLLHWRKAKRKPKDCLCYVEDI